MRCQAYICNTQAAALFHSLAYFLKKLSTLRTNVNFVQNCLTNIHKSLLPLEKGFYSRRILFGNFVLENGTSYEKMDRNK